jgi:transketolase
MNYQTRARRARIAVIEMSFSARAGHIPSALGMVDYLSVIFDHIDWGTDRVLLGKPFGAQAYYALFADYGLGGNDWERYGGDEPGWTYIIDRDHPHIHYIDDSMGNALAVACGVAEATDGHVWVNVSDATLQTGTFWEAANWAGGHKLANLIVTVDHNDQQVGGAVSDISPIEPIDTRLGAFGWRALRCAGHDFDAIETAVAGAFGLDEGPTVVVFDTIKGAGISFMAGDPGWHYRKLDADTHRAAIEELA